MQVKVRNGFYALVRGFEWYSGTVELSLAIAANSSGSTRFDLVVLRLNRATWNVTVEVLAGAAGSGVPPTPTQTIASTGVWELPLATVTVASGAATIAAGDVTYIACHLASDGSGLRVSSPDSLAYVPAPFAGQLVASSDGLRYRYSGTAWRRHPAAPVVAVLAADVLFGTTEGSILAADWTVQTGDVLKVTVSGTSHSNGDNRQLILRLKEDGVVIRDTIVGSPASNLSWSFAMERHRTPGVGTHTYSLTAQWNAFTGYIEDGTELSISMAA